MPTRLFESTRVLFVAFVSLLIVTSSCKTRGTLSQQKSDESFPMGDFNALAENRFGIVCGLLMANEDASCKSQVITATCSQGKKSLSEAIKSLMDDPSVSKFKEDAEKFSKMDTSIRSDFFMAVNGQNTDEAGKKFTSAADRCLNAQKYKEAEEFEALAKTPEFQERAAKAKSDFWKAIAFQATTEAVKQSLTLGVGYLTGKVAAPNTAISMSQLFYASICAGGFQFAAGFAKSTSEQTKGDECAGARPFNFQRMWSKECLNVYAASCSAYTGAVELRNLGIQTESQIANFVLDTANFGLWGLCNAGGPAIRVSCGVINYSANQIGMAIKTGDNDLARCAGTTQLGACIGKMWGQGRWTNSNGVEVARTEVDKSGNKWPVKACCLCKKDWYRSVSFSTDPKTSSENWMGVIQSGDVSSGNCGMQDGKRVKYDEENYYIYSQCKRVEVVASGCSLQETEDGSSTLKDAPKVLWDTTTKSPKGVVSRTSIK